MLRLGPKRFWVRLGLVLTIWTALSLLLTAQAFLVIQFGLRARDDLGDVTPAVTLPELFYNVLADCLVWAFLTLLIFWLGKRFPFTKRTWRRSVLAHALACLIFGFFQAAGVALAGEVLRHDIPKPTLSANVLFFFFVAKLNNNVFFYWAILAVSQILSYYRQLRDRELRASQLEAKLAQAQLQVLKMQLHPHFLFNTLHAISALIHKDVELADRMIARLGDLLRTTLENANRQEIPLQQELGFIEPYLEIEKARLGPRLTVQLDIDPAAMEASVPNLILQPLVENAIRHGIAPRAEPGKLAIQARRENGCLHLAVVDDGPGLRLDKTVVQGIGLSNTRARLENLYGVSQRLDLVNVPGGGLRVAMTIPFREANGSTVAEVV
jgi:two-component system, LytTR family, sensor kinase